MIKNRRFLSGLGVGLILGAILLQIMNSMNSAGTRNELIYTQSQFDAALEKQLNEAKSKASPTITPSATPTDLKSGSALSTPSASAIISELPKPTNSTPESPKPPEIKKSVTIIDGMTSIEVTNLFFNNGIILDKEAFLAEIIKHQLERKMQIGSYSFDSSAKIVDMVKTISTPLK